VKLKPLIALLALWPLTLAAEPENYRNPVIPGDHPDPSIIRAGSDYWAVSTSSEWGPEFPLMHSVDLVNWQTHGAVFPHTPDWASGNFWAPEISQFSNRFFVYYAARIKGGPLAVAVTTADRPQGPYQDHGPIVAQEDGSIDPAPATDEHGRRFLIWKEDGNSRNLPSIIWAQPLDSNGTAVVGEPKALIASDVDWEGKVVEGPFILRHSGWFYLFYSGNGCCGRRCHYAMGAARSRSLLGPWEKDPANPILAENRAWRCPGHGSIVQDQNGRYWLLYHGYSSEGFVFTGRQALLDEVKFGNDGWPTINNGNGPSVSAPSPLGVAQQAARDFNDDFSGDKLREGWQWPQDNEPVCRVHDGALDLRPSKADQTNIASAVVAWLAMKPDFVATVSVDTSPGRLRGAAGLVVMGDCANVLGLGVSKDEIRVWEIKHGAYRPLAEKKLAVPPKAQLRVTSHHGATFDFAVRAEGGAWTAIAGQINGDDLPPWDRGVRVGVSAGGERNALGRFSHFNLAAVR
jgi:beta-xylosidase